MNYGFYVSAAGALANSYRQDVAANNLANVDTVAFKRDMALMQGRRTESSQRGGQRYSNPLLEQLGGGLFALPTHTDFSAGSLDLTGNPYDFALDGSGFFQVKNQDQIQYTRDGRFKVDEQNQLVTVTEHLPVLDESGAPITLIPGLDFSVSEAGVVNQEGVPVGRLGVVDFDDTTDLKKQGNNLYIYQGEGLPHAVLTPVKQGALENSGAVAVQQLVEMIKAQRSFQMNLSSLQMQDETLGMAVNRLGSIS
jgi:flagellar basal-body rod protein FlgF